MVTPRKPGAKRGRPRKVSPDASVPIAVDDDRYHLALADALILMGKRMDWHVTWVKKHNGGKTTRRTEAYSERAACLLAAVLHIGSQWRPPAENGMTFWEKKPMPGSAHRFEGHAKTLAEKRARYRDPTSSLWRAQMARAFVLALSGNADDVHRHATKAQVVTLAQVVGEGAFAERVLLAMADAVITGNLPSIAEFATADLPD